MVHYSYEVLIKIYLGLEILCQPSQAIQESLQCVASIVANCDNIQNVDLKIKLCNFSGIVGLVRSFGPNQIQKIKNE